MSDTSTAAPEPGSARRRDRMRRGRRGEAGEHLYRVKKYRGATYFTSRQQHQDLTVVLERFPSAPDVDDSTAPLFVMVHGLGVSSRYFEPVAAELAKVGKVFLVDLPGYGRAPDPKRDVSITDHAAALGGVIEELARRWPDDPVPVIVGHSMGSQVVASLAAQHPDVAQKLVLMAPTIAPDLRAFRPAGINLLRDSLREPPRVIWIAGSDYLVRCGLPYLLKQAPHLFTEEPLEERMPQLQVDVLVICGDRDAVVPVEYGRKLAELLPHAEFLEVHGPHAVMHTDPKRIAEAIYEFSQRPVHEDTGGPDPSDRLGDAGQGAAGGVGASDEREAPDGG